DIGGRGRFDRQRGDVVKGQRGVAEQVVDPGGGRAISAVGRLVDLDHFVLQVVPAQIVAVVVERLEVRVRWLVGDDGVVTQAIGHLDVEVRGNGGTGTGSEPGRIVEACDAQLDDVAEARAVD